MGGGGTNLNGVDADSCGFSIPQGEMSFSGLFKILKPWFNPRDAHEKRSRDTAD
jgi:hypothetical protein